MLTLTGKLFDVQPPGTNSKTGELILPAVEIVRKVRGKSEFMSLKIDTTVEAAWRKAIGQTVTVEIYEWFAEATKDRDAGFGFVLADKKALPTVQAAAPRAVPAAA